MKLRTLFIISGLLIHTYSYSQVYEFIVCGSRGVNSVKTNGEWKLLKTSETFNNFDEIKTTGADCYLGLLHSSGRSVVIRKPGTYMATDILNDVKKVSTAVASKYADFVFTKMTAVSNISQPVGQRSTGNSTVKVYLPPSCQVFGNSEIIRWESLPDCNFYKISIFNMFDESIANYTSDTSIFNLNLDNQELTSQNALFLTIESQDDPSTRSAIYGISRLSSDDYKTIEGKYNQLISELAVNSPLNDLIISSFFEDYKLLIDANTYYCRFLNSAPDMNDFEKMYSDFLARNGMK